MVKVKFCGITNIDDAEKAVNLGIDALGFVFAQSPRRITPDKARYIINKLPPFVDTVGVFVDEEIETIRGISQYCGLSLVQLHGDHTPEFCDKLMPYAIKAFRVKDSKILSSIIQYKGHVRALLLDSYESGKMGGTGKTFDWELALTVRESGIPVILAGGLNLSNIENALSTVKPWAVDISSGIEELPGKKSLKLMKDLMQKIKNTE